MLNFTIYLKLQIWRSKLTQSDFNMSQFTSCFAVTGSFVAGAIYTGVKAATVASVAGKVSLAAASVFLIGASVGSVIAGASSNNTNDYFKKLPKSIATSGGLFVQTIATAGLTSMFQAIFESLGQAIGDSIYKALTGKDKNTVHIRH